MAGNSIGQLFRLTTFGESHGKAIGGIIDGCPPGFSLDISLVQKQLDRRKPGQSAITTQRKEKDQVEFLSGIFEGKTTGTPIGFIILNDDAKSKDYDHLKDVYRPSHADYTYDAKYGLRDHRGGGRSSARETACRVVAGAIAAQLLHTIGVQCTAFVASVGPLALESVPSDLSEALVDSNIVRCPDSVKAEAMIEYINAIRKAGDTIGGTVRCIASGVPAGWGEPVFDKLHADLAKAMMSINAVKAFELGSGTAAARMRGSEHNDLINADKTTNTNYSGGVQGGISNGAHIDVTVSFKPIATLMRDQKTVDSEGNPTIVAGKGRHDPCVVPRAVPIVQAMMCLTLVDHWLRQKVNQ